GEFGPMHEFVGDFEEVPFGGSRWYRVPFALWVLAGDVQRRSRNGVIDVRVGYPPSLTRFLGIRMSDSVIPVPDAFATRLPHGLPQLHLDASAEMCLVTTAFPWRRTGQHRDRGVFVDRKSTRLNSSHVKNSYAVFCLQKTNHCLTHASQI